jgi:hypothetical protein
VNLGLVSYLGGSIMVQFGGPLVSARTSGTPSHSTSFPSGGTGTVDGETQQIDVTY